jgi:hypothetical protein
MLRAFNYYIKLHEYQHFITLNSCVRVFCRGCIESKEHLFFECGYSRRLWRELLKKTPIPNPPIHCSDIMRMSVKERKNKSSKAVICKLSLSSAVYYLWRQKNDTRHGSPPKSGEKMLQEVLWSVKTELRGKASLK